MRAAAAAWDGLASELQSTAASSSSVISTLTNEAWSGPSSLNMVAAVTPYLTWMQGTAAQAAEAASQATAAANAYETAFAAHVPPAEIAANRSQLASLVTTNIFGQNTAAIAATETQYAEMWAQDALAMDSYAGSSAAASKLTAFTAPPQVTNANGLASQAAAVTQAAGTPASSVRSLLSALDPLTTANPVLQWLANLSTDYTHTIDDLLNGLFGPNAASTFGAMVAAVDAPTAYTLQFADVGVMSTFPITQFLKFAPTPAVVLPKEGLGGGLALLAPSAGRGAALFGSVSASMGDAGTLVGKLSIPPSWATATPAIRTVAAALSAVGPQAVPAAALAEGSLLSSMSVAGMLGSALGGGAPSAAARSGVPGGFTAFKDLKDKHSPEQLQRLVAQITEKPESVQHHAVDQDGLDSLLEQLSKKPGIHAVHLINGGNAKVVPSDSKLG
jgi:PPE-repeat protein